MLNTQKQLELYTQHIIQFIMKKSQHITDNFRKTVVLECIMDGIKFTPCLII